MRSVHVLSFQESYRGFSFKGDGTSDSVCLFVSQSLLIYVSAFDLPQVFDGVSIVLLAHDDRTQSMDMFLSKSVS